MRIIFTVILQNYHQLQHIVTHRTDMDVSYIFPIFLLLLQPRKTIKSHNTCMYIAFRFMAWLSELRNQLCSPIDILGEFCARPRFLHGFHTHELIY